MLYVFIHVLPHPLSLASHGFLLVEEVGGWVRGMSGGGCGFESDLTTTPAVPTGKIKVTVSVSVSEHI